MNEYSHEELKTMRSYVLVSLLCFIPLACSSGGLQVGRDDLSEVADAAGGQTACQSGGGTCVLGNVSCAEQAPEADQDCNPDKNPGGSFCCLSKSSTTDSGATSACVSAGGACVLGDVSCAKQAPEADQDCNPDKNPGGAFCCLSKETACQSAGGKCVLGNVTCAKQAPEADQDCGPAKNPGGTFCCLTE
jgi:hypothetical protein